MGLGTGAHHPACRSPSVELLPFATTMLTLTTSRSPIRVSQPSTTMSGPRPDIDGAHRLEMSRLSVVRQLKGTGAAPAAWDHLGGVVEVGGVMMVAPTVVVKSPA